MSEPNKEDLRAYRRKHFQVEVRRENAAWSDDWLLRVTHNGNQWSSIRLDEYEMALVIAALQEVLRG